MKMPDFVDRFLERLDDETLRHVLETTDWSAIPPAEKVRLVEAMGFTPFRDQHQPDCPVVWDSGLRCSCVQPTTMWGPPDDVQVLRKETWDDRLKQKREWEERRRR